MTSHIDSDTGTNADMTHTATLQTLAASGDQPGWRVLDTARTQQFTGEITFQVEPSISVYFDGGMAYHAVRSGDLSFCARLVDEGVLEPAQVERGVIRVGNVENLGRLFDRDPSVDRDAVMVVLELATDDVVTAIANTVTGSIALTAYRHHVSGVHRWFVSPSGAGEQPAQLTPVGEVAQIDGSVTGDLPGLSVTPTDDDIHIEWDQPLTHEPDVVAPVHAVDDDLLAQLFGDIDPPASMNPPVEPQAEFDDTPSSVVPPVAPTFTAAPTPDLTPAPDLAPPAELAASADVAPIVDAAPASDVAQPVLPMDLDLLMDSVPESDLKPDADPVSTATEPVDSTDVPMADGFGTDDGILDDFQILWPDGSEQHLVEPNAQTDDRSELDTAVDDVPKLAGDEQLSSATTAEPAPIEPAALEPAALEPAAVEPAALEPAAVEPDTEDFATADATSSLTFNMPGLALTDDNVPHEQQPDVVVDAVRRALDAIEAASAGTAHLPSVDVGPLPAFQPTTALQFDVVDPLAHETGETTSEAPAVAASVPTASAVSALESILPFDGAVVADNVVTAAPVDTAPATASAAATVAPAALGGFAPPTLNDSAEAVYARAAAVEQPTAAPASGVASVVFVDEAPDESDDRSGALKRLIGSLRRK